MGIEQKINTVLQKHPGIKKAIKRVYQLGMYSVSSKIKSEGNIKRLTPIDDFEYFFGYYDKSPWDANEEYLLCLRVKDTTKSAAPNCPADIILINQETKEIEKIAQTSTWNIQQGAMLQWLGPDFTNEIIYNDFRDGEYVSVILDIKNKNERVLKLPLYSVSSNGEVGLSLDFSRLHRLRPGYGYSNKSDQSTGQLVPEEAAIIKVNIQTNECVPLISYKDLYQFEHRKDMEGAEHKVNHIMISPSANRFMVLHRWLNGTNKYTRLLTMNMDGTDLYNLSDDNMVSHCFWKNDEEIIGFARKQDYGNGYFLMKDKSKEFKHLWPEITMDGHPSYSPTEEKIVIDTYPDRARLQKIFVLDESEQSIEPVGKVFAPFKYDNEFRCDLHPRWNREGNKISFDATFEGKRALYELNV